MQTSLLGAYTFASVSRCILIKVVLPAKSSRPAQVMGALGAVTWSWYTPRAVRAMSDEPKLNAPTNCGAADKLGLGVEVGVTADALDEGDAVPVAVADGGTNDGVTEIVADSLGEMLTVCELEGPDDGVQVTVGDVDCVRVAVGDCVEVLLRVGG